MLLMVAIVQPLQFNQAVSVFAGRAEGRNLYEVAAEMRFGPCRRRICKCWQSNRIRHPQIYHFYGWYYKPYLEMAGRYYCFANIRFI